MLVSSPTHSLPSWTQAPSMGYRVLSGRIRNSTFIVPLTTDSTASLVKNGAQMVNSG